MSKTGEFSHRKALERIGRLEKRAEVIRRLPAAKITQIAELSALEWAIPILKQNTEDIFGNGMVPRRKLFKHEQWQLIARLVSRDGSNCHICGKVTTPNDVSIDHVIPLSKGGKDHISNFRLAHVKCNNEKGNKILPGDG